MTYGTISERARRLQDKRARDWIEDSYTKAKLGIVGVRMYGFKLPEDFVIARKLYRKLAARGVSQWPLVRYGAVYGRKVPGDGHPGSR